MTRISRMVFAFVMVFSLVLGTGLSTANAASEQVLPSTGMPAIELPQNPANNPRLQGNQPSPQWGTSSWIISQIAAYQFVPIDSTVTYSYDGPQAMRYRTGGSFWFEANPDLPAGAYIQGLELYGCDNNATSNIAAWLFDCSGGSCTTYGGSLTSGTPGCGYYFYDLSSAGLTVDKYNHNYSIEVRLEATDSTTEFRGVNLYYTLQVSPPPASATFTDVPTTHPFFQYVEALVASGITGGCSATQYCPNDPITRGQMAVFLARALGLHWPY